MHVADSYMLFKVRKNHNHGSNGVWGGSKAIMGLCVVGIINHNIVFSSYMLFTMEQRQNEE